MKEITAMFRPERAHAWSKQTHTDITENALALIESEKKQKLIALIKPYRDQFLKGSIDPDREGDIDKGTGSHYYSATNSKGKAFRQVNGYYPNRLGNFAKSARTMFEDNYTCALNLYRNGRQAEGIYYLGRAAHFLEDMSNPVHTASMKFEDKATNPHKAFEKHAVNIAKRYTATQFDKRLVKAFSGDSFETALNKLCETANKLSSTLTGLDPKAFEEAVKVTAPLAVQNVVALVNRFSDDISKDNANFLVDGISCHIRNEGTGLIITQGAKSVQPERLDPDREKPQKMTLIMSGAGTFAIRVPDGQFLSGNLKALDTVLGDAQGEQLRFTALGKNRYRVSPEVSRFEKVLACTKSGSLVLTDYDPADKNQVWIINK